MESFNRDEVATETRVRPPLYPRWQKLALPIAPRVAVVALVAIAGCFSSHGRDDNSHLDRFCGLRESAGELQNRLGPGVIHGHCSARHRHVIAQ
jgi:hypothetical protein